MHYKCTNTSVNVILFMPIWQIFLKHWHIIISLLIYFAFIIQNLLCVAYLQPIAFFTIYVLRDNTHIGNCVENGVA